MSFVVKPNSLKSQVKSLTWFFKFIFLAGGTFLLFVSVINAAETPPFQIVSQSPEGLSLRLNLEQIQSTDFSADNWLKEELIFNQALGFSREGLHPNSAEARFVVIPPGKKASLQFKDDKLMEALQGFIKLGQPVRLRHLQLAPLIINDKPFKGQAGTPFLPVGGDGQAGTPVQAIELEIRFLNGSTFNSTPYFHDRIPSPAFQRMVESLTLNPPAHCDDAELIRQRGYNEFYLFVLPADISENLVEYVDQLVYRLREWKLRSGNKVDLLRVHSARDEDEGPELVLEQLQNYYNEVLERGEEPPDNIFLIGEEELHPMNNENRLQGLDIVILSPDGAPEDPNAGHWDLRYGMLEGDDFIPDAAVARFQAGDLATLANLTNKTLSYEAQPSLVDPTWFEEAAVVEESIIADQNTIRLSVNYLVQCLEKNNLQVIDQWRVRQVNASVPAEWIARHCNAGVGMIVGRAQMSSVMLFGNPEAGRQFQPSLAYPVVLLSAGHGEYTAESLLWFGREYYDRPERYDDPSGARGAVIATATWGDPQTVPNNLLVMGMTHAMLDLGLSAGWARNWSLLTMLRTFPELPDLATRYSDEFQLSGDPGLVCWKRAPKPLNVVHPARYSEGTSYIQVSVTEAAGGKAVPGAVVTLFNGSQNDGVNLHLVEVTDADGSAAFILPEGFNQALTLTVTGKDLYPYTSAIELAVDAVCLTPSIIELRDLDGNQDGLVNPGERISLRLALSNIRANPAHNARISITSDSPYLVIETGLAQFGDIAANNRVISQDRIIVRVTGGTPDNEDLRLLCEVQSQEFQTTTALSLDPNSYNPQVNPDDLDIIIEDDTELALRIMNRGRVRLPASAAILVALDWTAIVNNAQVEYPSIAPQEMQAPLNGQRFIVSKHPQAIPGTLAPFELRFTSGGPTIARCKFSLQVSEPADSCPQLPDAYGYRCYDDTDAGWELAPRYQWIEISPWSGDPELEGDLVDFGAEVVRNVAVAVDLPFRFKFYGGIYHRITICSSGFVVLGDQPNFVSNFHNWPLEQGGLGAGYGIIAPYWDNLLLQIRNFGGVFTAYDDLSHAFIIEWYNAHYDYDPQGPRLSFQILLYETDVLATPTGDGLIKFNYRQIQPGAAQDIDHTPYMTVGLASPEGTTGLTYVMANNYPLTSAPIVSRRALVFTTASRRVTGTIAGEVRDAATGRLLSGARILPTLAAPVQTDNLGRWQTTVYAGVPFQVKVQSAGFNDFRIDIPGVDIDGRVELPVGLRKPIISASRQSVDVLLETNDLRTRGLIIRNRGNGVLDWAAALTREGEDPQTQWTQLNEAAIGRLEAALFIDNHYIIALRDLDGVNRLAIMDPNLNIEAQYEVGLRTREITDLAWEEGRRLIWFAQGSRLVGVNWDGETIETYNAAGGVIQGVACEPGAEGLLWFAAGGMLCGLNRDREIVHEIELPRQTVRGLAWREGDPFGHPLFVMLDEAESHYTIIRVNPEDLEHNLTLPDITLPIDDGSFPRGLSISEDYRDGSAALLVASNFADPARNKLRIYQLGERLGWVSVNPAYGQVAPGGEQGLELTFNSTGLPRQLYNANLHILHNGAGGDLTLNVDMEVVGEHPPAPFALSKPGNGAARDTSWITFTWEPSYDPNPQQWTGYQLWLQMRQDSLRFQPADTFFTVLLDTLFPNITPDVPIRWWVKAFGGRDSTECQERWTFRVDPAGIPHSNPEVPVEFGLRDIYPNPFNSRTRIKFGIEEIGPVRLDIYDLTGRSTARLVDETLRAGGYTVSWDAADVPTGIYWVRLKTDRRVSTQKIAIVR